MNATKNAQPCDKTRNSPKPSDDRGGVRKKRRIKKPKHLRKSQQDSSPVPKSIEREIPIHPAALALRPLSQSEFEMLRQQILQPDGTIHLTTKIVVNANGKIVDGRHRASIIVEAGYLDKLLAQIEARGGEWVEPIDEDVDPYVFVFKCQSGRRNTSRWQSYFPLLEHYERLLELGKQQFEAGILRPGQKTPVQDFLEQIDISSGRISEIRTVRDFATPEELQEMDEGHFSFHRLLKICRKRKEAQRQDRPAAIVPLEPAEVLKAKRKKDKKVRNVAEQINDLLSDYDVLEQIDVVARLRDLIDPKYLPALEYRLCKLREPRSS